MEIQRKLRRRAHSRHPENDTDDMDDEDAKDFLSSGDLGGLFNADWETKHQQHAIVQACR